MPVSTPSENFVVLTNRAGIAIVKGMTMESVDAENGFSAMGMQGRPEATRWGGILARLSEVLKHLDPAPSALSGLEGPLREVVLWASENGRLHLSLRAQTVVRGIRQHSSHDLADALPKLIRELDHAAWSLRSDPNSA